MRGSHSRAHALIENMNVSWEVGMLVYKHPMRATHSPPVLRAVL